MGTERLGRKANTSTATRVAATAAVLFLLPMTALGQVEHSKAPRLTSIEDIFVDGAMDADWSNLSFGYTNVSAPTVESRCYDLESWGAVSFARDSDRIWVGGSTYLEAVVKVEGAVDVLVSLEGLADGKSVVTGPVSASEVLVAASPDDGDALDELLAGDWVDLRVRLKDLLEEVDAEEVPLTQIVLSLKSATEDELVERSEERGDEGRSARLCVAGVVIVD